MGGWLNKDGQFIKWDVMQIRSNLFRQSFKSKRNDAECSLDRMGHELGLFGNDVFMVCVVYLNFSEHLWKDIKGTGNNGCLCGYLGA